MASAPIVTKESSVLTLSNLTMTTSVSFQGLKPPPPLATTKFVVDTTNNNNSHNSDKQQHPQLHHHHGGSTASSTSESAEYLNHGHIYQHQHHSSTSLNNNNNSNIIHKSNMPSSPRKSVEFILHPPPSKRTKLDTAWTAKQVVDGKYKYHGVLLALVLVPGVMTEARPLLPARKTEEGSLSRRLVVVCSSFAKRTRVSHFFCQFPISLFSISCPVPTKTITITTTTFTT